MYRIEQQWDWLNRPATAIAFVGAVRKIFHGPSRTYLASCEKLCENHSCWAGEEAWEVWRAPARSVFSDVPSIVAFSSGSYFPQEQGGHQKMSLECALHGIALWTGSSQYLPDMQLDAGANCFFVAVLLKGVWPPLRDWKFTPLGLKGGVAWYHPIQADLSKQGGN